MYKLLIADDEKLEREALRYFVNQSSLDIGEIIECANGNEAVKQVLLVQPDIILLDINMPGLNGLDAFDYFEYAVKALQLGAMDFLVKPVDQKRLLSVLVKAMDQLDAEADKAFQEQKRNDVLELMSGKILKKLVTGEILTMKKICTTIGIFFTASLALLLVACTRQGGSVYPGTTKAEPSPDAIYTMQIGHAHGVTSPRHQALKAFKSMVEERAKGGMIVNIFLDGQLDTKQGMHDEVQAGTLQGMWGGEFEMLSKLMIFTLPFLAENELEMERLLDSELIQEICERAKEKGVIVLGIGCGGGFRQFSNNVHPIRTPEDIEGLRMRVNDIDTISRTMKALGADVSSASYNDLYRRLKSGAVDGQENPWSNIVSMRFYEVQKYFTQIDYQFHPNPFYVNLKWYQFLPVEYQKILKENSETMMDLERRYEEENRQKALETIRAYAEVYVPTSEEREAFKEKGQIVYDSYLEEGLVTQEELDRMYAIMDGQSN